MSLIKVPPSTSPFAARSAFYVDNGLMIVPIAPGTKKPGAYSGGQWHNMKDWNKFFVVNPTGWQIDSWGQWPDAGIGLLLGKLSGVVAIDIDTDDITLISQITSLMPPSPVRKKGKKGFTAFYRYNGEVPRSWDVRKERVVDLLSEGRQTLMPGTQHPDGMSYIYLTDDTLEEFDKARLPVLPTTFCADLDALLEPLQTVEDKAARRERSSAPRDDGNELFQNIASQMWKTINQTALDRLDDWVPLMISGAKPDGKGYRCRAYWRGAENPNVGIHHTGIRDFGNGVGLTPIDLVMYATNTTFEQAQKALRWQLGLDDGKSISITVNAKEPLAKPRPDEPSVDLSKFMIAPKVKAPAPVLMPRADIDPMVAVHEERERVRAEEAAAQASQLPEFVANAPGVIGEIADWINLTAPKSQPEFAVVAALAIGATVMGRRFVTDRNNFPSMAYIIMAESGEGKDHPQKCVRKVLDSAGLGKMIGGAGYTSSGAVFTALMTAPSHVAIIDEFGQLLKTAGKAGSQNTDGAFTKLMEAFTNVDNQIRPPTYSQMGMSKRDIAAQESKIVYNPAISMMCATTPGVFFGALGDDHVTGGFLNRFLMVQTNEPIRVGKRPTRAEPPEGALAWCREIVDEHSAGGDMKDVNDPGVPAIPVPMLFDGEADRLIVAFDADIVAKRKGLDPLYGQLLTRSLEKACRISMVVAKATNAPRDNLIRADAVRWAIKYVKHYDWRMVTSVETQRPQSRIEGRLQEVEKFMKRTKTYRDATYLKVTSTGAMPHSLLLKKLKVDSREMILIMQTAIDTGLVHKQAGLPEVGFAGDVYYLRGAAE